MWLAALSLIVILALVVLATAVISALLLALGSLLSRAFAVSVFEATLVLLIVGGAIVWLLMSARSGETIDVDALEEDEPPVVITSVPLPTVQRGKKRRR